MSSENEPARTSPFGHPTLAEALAEVGHEKQLMARDGVIVDQVVDVATAQNEPILRYFRYEHLPPALQIHSKPWHDLAEHLVTTLPRSDERTVALRKLLEGKDAAVRAALP